MANNGPTLEQRLNPSVERARALMDMVLQSMRVALPAVVTSLSAGPPLMVNVQVATNEYVERNIGGDKVSIGSEPIPLPELRDVPVLMPSAGGWSLTFPIQPGDECLIVFADTALDVWHQSGGTDNNPISQRRHNLSDGVAIFGLRSRPRGLSGYSTDSAQLRNDDGSVVIELKDDTVKISSPKAEVHCTEEVRVIAPQVLLGTEIKLRDFLSHIHPAPNGNTGGVI